MEKLKFYQKVETIATVSWLCMDFCWMSNYVVASMIFATIAICFSYLAVGTYADGKKSEFSLLGASFFWVEMNTAWMCGEMMKEEWLVTIGRFSFLIVLGFLFAAFYYNKKESNEQVDFKRLKIK